MPREVIFRGVPLRHFGSAALLWLAEEADEPLRSLAEAECANRHLLADNDPHPPVIVDTPPEYLPLVEAAMLEAVREIAAAERTRKGPNRADKAHPEKERVA